MAIGSETQGGHLQADRSPKLLQADLWNGALSPLKKLSPKHAFCSLLDAFHSHPFIFLLLYPVYKSEKKYDVHVLRMRF